MSRRILRLLQLAFARSRVVSALIAIVFFGGWLFWAWRQQPADLLVGAGIAWLLMGWTVGSALRSLLRPETLLLPRLREALLAAAGVLIGLGIVLPSAAILPATSVFVSVLAASGLLLVMALAVVTGLGYRVTFLLIWPWIIVNSWYPTLSAQAAQAAVSTWFTPLVLVLSAILALALGLRPLLITRDRDDDQSPMQAMTQGIRGARGSISAGGQTQRRGLIARRLQPLHDAGADYAFRRALKRFRARASAGRRMRTIRTVLLPYDNALGMALNAGALAVFVTLFLWINPDTKNWQAGLVGFYAVILGMSRINAVAVAMAQMRPSLAELYMTLAPTSTRAFQATIADALRWLVVVATVQALIYGALIAGLLHAAEPARLLLAIAIAGAGSAGASLGVALIAGQTKTARLAIRLGMTVVAALVYGLVYGLLGVCGIGLGGLVSAAVVGVAALIVWRDTRELFMRRSPRFDAPMDP